MPSKYSPIEWFSVKVCLKLCKDRIDDLKQKRQSYEYEQNFLLLDPLIKKIDLLKKDIEQF
jgi:hypothetical protein